MVLALGNTPKPRTTVLKILPEIRSASKSDHENCISTFSPPWSPFWNWKFSSLYSATTSSHSHHQARAQWRHEKCVSVYWCGRSSSDFPFPIRVRVQYLRGGVFPPLNVVAVTCTWWLASFVWKLFFFCWRKIPPSNGLENADFVAVVMERDGLTAAVKGWGQIVMK